MKVHSVKAHGQDEYGSFRLTHCGIPVHQRSPIPTETMQRSVTCRTCKKLRSEIPARPVPQGKTNPTAIYIV